MDLQRLPRLVLATVVAVLVVAACGQSGPTTGAAVSTAVRSEAAVTTPPPASPSATAGTTIATATAQPTPAPTTVPTLTSVPTPLPTAGAEPTMVPSPTFSPSAATATAGPDLAAVARGKAVFASAGCGLCHTIQGVSTGNQCPNLTHIATEPIPSPPWDQLSNDPAFLHQWIKNPQAIKPGNLMPNLGLTDEQVSDVVAFLETQR